MQWIDRQQEDLMEQVDSVHDAEKNLPSPALDCSIMLLLLQRGAG